MLNDKLWLESRYIADEMTTTQIATLCGVSHKTVSRWLHRHGIPVRSNRIAQLKVGSKFRKNRNQQSNSTAIYIPQSRNIHDTSFYFFFN
jgi:IS30 family transposase